MTFNIFHKYSIGLSTFSKAPCLVNIYCYPLGKTIIAFWQIIAFVVLEDELFKCKLIFSYDIEEGPSAHQVYTVLKAVPNLPQLISWHPILSHVLNQVPPFIHIPLLSSTYHKIISQWLINLLIGKSARCRRKPENLGETYTVCHRKSMHTPHTQHGSSRLIPDHWWNEAGALYVIPMCCPHCKSLIFKQRRLRNN